MRVTGGWDLTDLKNDLLTQYRNIKQTYSFSYYTNSGKTSKKHEVTGASGNDGKINIEIYGLTEGEKNNIKVTISYSYEVRVWVPNIQVTEGGTIDLSDWGSWESKTSSGTNQDNIDVFTKNTKAATDFWGNPQTGNYIDQHITKINVNNWIKQLGVWKSWKTQNDYRNSYDSHKNPSGDITAGWYNTLSGYCSGSYTVSRYNQYISAEHFKDLARKVTTWS